ncbi:UDP-N-acetylglucosamine--N-acetylmuramyl-(pentapeptide) pyrophosphoryl-undecaprenol N-acetylglucosamine transferase [Ornithinicoccus halotolerans]|uniref:UDP-N-acetylglucosamine--N-acetylmuramyl- (pentapeptide) pyrophosphoryl-undecaprenol N-acetylglucosamine transferase n=1 Tax=Ornithinicoccus halotolerans TaxID=1748220 RepID=UPI001296BF37|nr:UDP-N-acetylglucosamine--N-acetylmuramyl-(pentapeptide) pyrophosphoryl-undecaprenol N-acetylglucosamine transferase [Ornithinicoccus halotolerans]
MTRSLSVLLAGGGSAGHVNPLLATADALAEMAPQLQLDMRQTVLGTAEGLEARLVPAAGYELRTVPKVPLPRRPDSTVVRFPRAMRTALAGARQAVQEVAADVVVGFGGYVSTPAYLAARRAGVPIVVHEQNARPGLANRLGARFTPHVAVTFPTTRLPHATVIGLPMRREISELDRGALREEACVHFGLAPEATTLLVFGGSLGAARLNDAFAAAAGDLVGAGVQVLHLTGAGKPVRPALPEGSGPAGAPRVPYVAVEYTDRMDLALSVADLAVCRAGAGTVSELSAVGLPAIYVPLPIGNGEQQLNALDVVTAGGGRLARDEEVDPAWVRDQVLPLARDTDALRVMSRAAAAVGTRDADTRLARMVLAAAGVVTDRGA